MPSDRGPCPRCGIVRQVKHGRDASLCRDCRATTTAEERELVWSR